jgi:hypothetical protein
MPEISVSAGFQRNWRGDLTHPDQAAGGLEQRLMDRLEEVLRLKKVRDPIERVVVDEDGAQQRLFGFNIVRRAPIGRSRRIGGEFENVRIS